jgi:hypothetical protein
MQNKLVLRKSLLAFMAIVMVAEVAGLWWPTPASPGGGGVVAAAPRNFVPHPMVLPQQIITKAREDAQRYQAVPTKSREGVPAGAQGEVAMAGRSSAMGRVLDTMPDGAVALSIGGATYYMAAGVYYRPIYQGDQVVYQVVGNPN